MSSNCARIIASLENHFRKDPHFGNKQKGVRVLKRPLAPTAHFICLAVKPPSESLVWLLLARVLARSFDDDFRRLLVAKFGRIEEKVVVMRIGHIDVEVAMDKLLTGAVGFFYVFSGFPVTELVIIGNVMDPRV
jgi:hypothetical protein